MHKLTLAEALKPAGYRTALYGKWHLGAHRDFGPKKQGFDEFFGIRDGFIDNYNHYFLHGQEFHDLYEETGNRIRAADHKSGYPKGHFYGASGGGNTGKWIGQKGSFLEGGIRVPAIISYPAKLPTGAVRDQIVTAMDWFPTVLALCGVKPAADAPELDGHNILPLIASPDARSEYRGVLHFAWGTKWAVRDGDWKLLGATDRKSGKTTLSLHNLADPKPELANHAADQPKIVARLQSLHDTWARDVAPQER